MPFRFKQFDVQDDACAMKVSTDAVLLGAWMTVEQSDRRMIDIGTGSGILALMAAQRCAQADITAVEIVSESATQAKRNFDNCPWKERLTAVNESIQAFASKAENNHRFDLIFSNPPYYSDSLKAPDAQRTIARHNDTLPHRELLDCVQLLLSAKGRFALILPTQDSVGFIWEAKCRGLFLKRRCNISSTAKSGVKRVLMEFYVEQTSATQEQSITIHEKSDYTPEYKSLTESFYLKF